MRIVALDLGKRRIGIAISDATRTLARPVGVLHAPALDERSVQLVADEIARLGGEDDSVSALVVGLPRRLDGSPTPLTPLVTAFAEQLGRATGLPVILQDERLSSVEADARLAHREKDWRVRKQRLDAAAAAVILQDYLDHQRDRPPVPSEDADS